MTQSSQQPSFKPVSAERAEQIRKALAAARSSSQGLVIDQQTGQFKGTAPLNAADPTKVNMIGKFDTHYAAGSPASGGAR